MARQNEGQSGCCDVCIAVLCFVEEILRFIGVFLARKIVFAQRERG